MILHVCFTFLLTVALVELVRLFPLRKTLLQLGQAAGRAQHVLRAPRISDHWKEKALLAYALRLMRGSLSLAALLILVAVLVWGAIVLGDGLSDGFGAFLLGWPGLLLSLVFASVYFWVRTRGRA